ncbi:hypothetical protein J6590_034505 [Homalodisca vitripennis]|nr:hypothetical protein J6590_034505 [Homalodisca vitripennis]
MGKAVQAGVTIVNEVGLDPGIDHLLAIECIDEIHQAGGKVESFVSYCGGLPAPEFSNNPLRYKFSWSPRGVLLNVLGNAKYMKNSKIVDVAAGGELLKSGNDLDFLPGFALEGYPNRDSLRYAQLYGIAAEVQTMFRGSIRYKGFLETMLSLKLLGLIDLNTHPALHPDGPDITWRELMCALLGLSHADIFYENLRSKVSERVGETQLLAVEKLGLMDDVKVVKCGTPIESLSHYLSLRLSLGEQERDVVILRHEMDIAWAAGQNERRDITMVEYGDGQGTSAMARTVGLPAAIAAKMVLDGEIQEHGMVYPLTPHIYRPMLSRLRAEGIVSRVSVEKIG